MLEIQITFAYIFIILGGALSAFTTRRPSRSASWSSAFLVLALGILPLGIAYSLRSLGLASDFASDSLSMYMLGSLLILISRNNRRKSADTYWITTLGSLIACVGILSITWGAFASNVKIIDQVWLLFILITTLCGIVIGQVLAGKNRPSKTR